MRHAIRILAAAAALPFLATAGAAQGSLGSQGLGYPLGGLSGGSAALAGANAESDPNSSLNPAAITRPERFTIMLRFEPEMRETTVGAQRAYANVIRFPGIQATGGLGRFVGAVGISPVLDRTWRNQVEDTIDVGGVPTPSLLLVRSEGAMSDARVALGYIVSRRLQLGVALHAITGESRSSFARSFADTSSVQDISQSNSFGFTGRAFSAGIVAEVLPDLLVSASGRFGQDLTVELRGLELRRATVPSRGGVGVSYSGIRGVTGHLRVDRVRWTDLEDATTATGGVFDGTEVAAGLEALGPPVFGVNSLARVGYRTRTLPFGVNGDQVDERGFAFGIGLPLARGRSQVDIGAQRLTRTVPGAKENSWFLTFGFGIRP